MTVNVEPWRFTVEEYVKMGEAGVFAVHERVELIEGEIVPMSPQDPPHASTTQRLTTLWVMAFGKTHGVRVQLPLTLGRYSEPEPDFALVPLALDGTFERHPTSADLVVELAHTTLAFDRSEKASLYAKAGISEYWIVNLAKNRLEVRQQPITSDERPYGWDYGSLQILAPGQTVAPLFAPETSFAVKELVGEALSS